MTYKLDRDCRLEPSGEGRYSVEITADWNIAAPNGGYLMALAGKALSMESEFPVPLSLSALFHLPPEAGRAELCVEEIHRGGRIRSAMVSLNQDGRERVRFMGVFSVENAFQGPTFIRGNEVPAFPALADCVDVDTDAVPLPFFRQVRMRVPPEQFEWIGGKSSENTRFSGYFEFRDGRPVDALGLLLLLDASPPPVMRRTGPLAWVPTIELSEQIRRVPMDVPRVCFRSRTRYATEGLVETDAELWDESGNLLAMSRQLALVKTG